MPIITTLPLQRIYVLRERAAGMYPASAGYIARSASAFPLALICYIFMAAALYWMVNLTATFVKWLLFTIILEVVVCSAISFGLAVGSAVPVCQSCHFIIFFLLLTYVLASESLDWVLFN